MFGQGRHLEMHYYKFKEAEKGVRNSSDCIQRMRSWE
jgi:hypothetical protein